MKKIIVVLVGIFMVLGATFYVAGSTYSKKDYGGSSTTSRKKIATHSGGNQHSTNSQTDTSSESYANKSAMSSSQSDATSSYGENPGTSVSNSESSGNQPNQDDNREEAVLSDGQGYAVYNGNDAVDVIKNVYKSAGFDLNALTFDVFKDDSNPNNFIVKLVVKSYQSAGGTGTAGIYRVEPSGHYTLIN